MSLVWVIFLVSPIQGWKCKETRVEEITFQIIEQVKPVQDDQICVQSKMENGIYYSIQNRTKLLPDDNVAFPCKEGAAVYCNAQADCRKDLHSNDSIQDCFSNEIACSRLTDYQTWLTCQNITTQRYNATDRLISPRCYNQGEFENEFHLINETDETQVEEIHRWVPDDPDHTPTVCLLVVYPGGASVKEEISSTFDQIKQPYYFDENGYCKHIQYGFLEIYCKNDKCNSYELIKEKYGDLYMVRNCTTQPTRKDTTVQTIVPTPETSNLITAFLIGTVIFAMCVVCMVLFVMVSRSKRCSWYLNQNGHRDEERLLPVRKSELHSIDLPCSAFLPDNIIAMRNNQQVMLLMIVDRYEEFDYVKAQINRNFSFIQWTEVTTRWSDATWHQLVDNIKNCLSKTIDNSLEIKLKKFREQCSHRDGHSYKIYQSSFEMEKPKTLLELIESQSTLTRNQCLSLMASLIKAVDTIEIRRMCEKLSTQKDGYLRFPAYFNITPSSILVDCGTLEKSWPTVKYIMNPHDRSQPLHRETTDNSNLYYMIECYITENHFMAEKWLTNGVKHMIGLIYQLSQPKVKRMIYERHPFYDLLQRLNKNVNNSKSRDLYIKWLKEDEGNQKWNSTFSHDPTFLASIEHLKPDARSDSDRIMTQYSVEQNRDSKMNIYNYIDRKIIMKKVPNYQYGIDMNNELNAYLWGYPNVAVCDMKLTDLNSFLSGYVNRHLHSGDR